MRVVRRGILCLLIALLSQELLSQNGVGFRFATNINTFPRANEYRLVEKGFTTGVFGLFFSNYKEKHGFELGANIVYKNNDDKGFPNLPVVMQDFGDDVQNVG